MQPKLSLYLGLMQSPSTGGSAKEYSLLSYNQYPVSLIKISCSVDLSLLLLAAD